MLGYTELLLIFCNKTSYHARWQEISTYSSSGLCLQGWKKPWAPTWSMDYGPTALMVSFGWYGKWIGWELHGLWTMTADITFKILQKAVVNVFLLHFCKLYKNV